MLRTVCGKCGRVIETTQDYGVYTISTAGNTVDLCVSCAAELRYIKAKNWAELKAWWGAEKGV